MIDIHTHILPGIDDGSRNIAMTEQMLEEEKRQGIEAVLATPHFYAYRHTIPQFLERRQASLEKVKESLLSKRDDLPKIAVGAEVYYFAGIGWAKELPELCYEGTDILLLEMPFTQWTREIYQDVREILYRQELTVVLAHVERYLPFQKDKSIFEQTLELPLYIQLNAEDLTARGKKRRWCLKQIAGDVQASASAAGGHSHSAGAAGSYQSSGRILLASDCHNTEDRAPNLEAAMAVIGKKVGAEAAARLKENANTLFASLI